MAKNLLSTKTNKAQFLEKIRVYSCLGKKESEKVFFLFCEKF